MQSLHSTDPDRHSPAEQNLMQAQQHFEAGELQDCLRSLIFGFSKDVNYLPLYQLAAECLGAMGAGEEQALFQAACTNNSDPEVFNKLGEYYFAAEHYALAAVFFEKRIDLDSGNAEAIHNLAICYARQFQVDKALELMETLRSCDFWDYYFLNKCKILNGRTEGVGETIHDLETVLNDHPDPSETLVPRMKLTELQEMLNRFNTVRSIPKHIREWHYIQYGSVILDYFDSNNDFVAGGRFVAATGSYESIRAVAGKLKLLIEALSVPVDAVASLEDRDSEITGRLLSKILAVPYCTYDPDARSENTLIVAADSSLFEPYDVLSTIHDGQLVFALNHNWLDNAMVNPDIIGFMSQAYRFPWNGGGLRLTDPDNWTFEETLPDNRDPAAVAETIFHSETETEGFTDHLQFFLEHREYLKGIGRFSGPHRYNFMIESPVPGSYFC
ncbi:MAG TPA: hypothetical protein VF145_06525 [Chitinophagaceae bacterium]